MKDRIDIGSGFSYTYFQWAPDWSINERKPGQPERIDPAGITIWRLKSRNPDQVVDDDAPDGMVWMGVAICWFDTPETKLVAPEAVCWQLISLEPLHLEPSIQMYDYVYGDAPKAHPSYHGYIRNGRWEDA